MRTRILVLVAALTLGLTSFAATGCGDDDEDEADTATESSSGGGDTASLDLLEEGVLTVGSDTPYPPFEFGDPPDYDGFDIDLINAIADELGLETAIVDAPFDVILAGQAGRFDLSIAATTITEARENRVDFSDPYFESEQSLLVQADGEIASIDDITADTVVGAEDGTTGETYADGEHRCRRAPVPRDRRRLQRARLRPGRRCVQRPRRQRRRRREQGGPRDRRDVPDRRALRDRLPRGLASGRARSTRRCRPSRTTARSPRSTTSGSARRSPRTCSARRTTRPEHGAARARRDRRGALQGAPLHFRARARGFRVPRNATGEEEMAPWIR